MTENENQNDVQAHRPDAEAPAEEPTAGDAPADEPTAAEPPPEPDEEVAADTPAAEGTGAADAEPGEPAEQLSAKQLRKRARSVHRGEAQPPRPPEERHRERLEARRKKADVRRKWRRRARERGRSAPKGEAPEPVARATGRPRVRQGVVVSDRADKTITVRIEIQRAHRVYGKVVRTSSTLHAHDERNEANAGDTVRVVESRPLSRAKRWRLVEILERAR
jgi:small subunit ribosomal protein S17